MSFVISAIHTSICTTSLHVLEQSQSIDYWDWVIWEVHMERSCFAPVVSPFRNECLQVMNVIMYPV